MEEYKPFRLSAEIFGHEGPVRAVQGLPDGRLASASQDQTAKFWAFQRTSSTDAGDVFYDNKRTLADHDQSVVSLAVLPAGVVPECPEGGLVTGCMDKLIRVYGHAGRQKRILQGHDGGVISLSWTSAGQLISGSWDGTAKVWDVSDGCCIITLGGHENGVCVLGLPDGRVATGSTGKQDGGRVVDFQIRIWSAKGEQLKSLRDHSGPVRSLDLAPSVGFMSTSNDGSARLWSLDGDPLAAMLHPATPDGRSAFVLQGCVLVGDASESVSIDESGECIVWRGSERAQSMPHPSGLWCVCALPNGDFATGGQDHAIRVWTREPGRIASVDVMKAFDTRVMEGQSKAKQGPSAVEVAALPKWESRHSAKGKSEGQVQLFQRDGKPIAAQWGAASSAWIEVGEVTGASEGGMIDGESFDRVYPIEVEGERGAVCKLQIGYNNGENPFVAAQRFLDKYQQPQSYLGQVADYITKRAGETPPTLGADASSSGTTSAGFSGVGDPTGFANATPPAVPGYGDRDTGGGTGGGHFPVKNYVTFETASLAKVEGKIREFDVGMTGADKMTEQELGSLSSMSATLSTGSRFHISKVTAQEMSLLVKLAEWPVDKCFPCLDLCRLAALHPHVAEKLEQDSAGSGPKLLKLVSKKCREGANMMPVVLCGLRFFCNLFRHKSSRNVFLAHASMVLDAISDQARSGVDNKTVKASLASLFLNVAVAAHQEPLQPGLSDAYQQLTALYLELLETASKTGSFADHVLYRVFAGLGTILKSGPTYLNIAKDLDLALVIASAREGRTEKTVAQCSKDLLDLFLQA